MVLRGILFVLLLAAGVVVDGAWLSRLPLPAGPDLLLLVVLAIALRHGAEGGALAGAAGGYLRDVAGGTPLGLYAFSYLVVGAAAGASSAVVDPRQRSVAVAWAVVGTGLLALVSGTMVAATGLARVTWADVASDAAVAAALNALLAGPVGSLVAWADRVTRRRYEGRVIGPRGLR
ncbi:MAG: rod shape-determining protein MreD [Armatimonadota bacterium]|nr:rod shape-determining protein MreD [Armatimonadota bacterium]